MDNAFASIDLLALETVTGGADDGGGPNRQEGSVNVGATVKGVQLGVQGTYKSAQTDYSTCVRETRAAGGTVADLRANCGLPGGGR